MPASDVVEWWELYRGRSRQAQVGNVPVYNRVFLVRVNKLNPNMVQVAAAPGIPWRAQYPDDPGALLSESATAVEDDSPFLYRLTYTYKYLDDTQVLPWCRPEQYSFSGTLASAPAFWYYPNANDNTTRQVIVNTAGDPLSGLDRDEAEFAVTIQWNVRPNFDYVLAQNYVGAINSDVWTGGAPFTWKVQSIQASRKFESFPGQTETSPPVQYFYWEITAVLAYKSTTWHLETWDVGFNEKIGTVRKKIMAGSEPVSEPAALSNGLAKTPGQPPDLLTFRIYRALPFKDPQGPFKELPSGATPLATYPYNQTC